MHKQTNSIKAILFSFILVSAFLFSFLLVFSPIVKADDSGWTDAGTVATGGGDGIEWAFPSQAKTQDDTYAQTTLTDVVIDRSIQLIVGGSIVGDNKSEGATWATSDTDTYVSFGGVADLWGNVLNESLVESSDFGVAIRAEDESAVTTEYLKFTNFGFAIPDGYVIDGVVMEMDRYYGDMLPVTAMPAIDHVRLKIYYSIPLTFDPDGDDPVPYSVENFEDDALGGEPSEGWHSYSDVGNTQVSSTVANNGNNSLEIQKGGTAEFTLNGEINESELVVSFWTRINYSAVDSGDYFEIELQNDSDDITKVVFDENWFVFDRITNTSYEYYSDMWYNVVWRLNFTSHEYNLMLYAQDRENRVYESYHRPFDDNCDELEIIYFTSSLDMVYIDDFEIYSPAHSPEASINSPANNSYGNNASTILTVDVIDLDFEYNDSVNTTFYLYEPDILGGSWITKGSIILYANGTASYLCSGLLANTDYYWFVTVNDSTGLGATFPEDNATDQGMPMYGFGLGDLASGIHFGWVFHSENNSAPTASSSIDGESFTCDEWKTNYNLVINVIDPEGDIFYLDLAISTAWDVINIIENDYPEGGNGTFTFDLSDYVFFNNMDYSIACAVYEPYVGFGGVLSYSAVYYFNFSIGTFANKDYYFAIGSVSPDHHDNNNFENMHDGFVMYHVSNLTAGMDYEVSLIKLYEKNVIVKGVNGSRYYTYGEQQSFWQNDALTTSWQGIKFWKNLLRPRELYRICVGLNHNDYPMADTEFSCLYEMPCEYDLHNWSLGWAGSYGKLLRWGYHDSSAYDERQFYGFRFEFGTFPDGDTPYSIDQDGGDSVLDTTGSNWADRIETVENELGIGGLKIIAGLILVVVFALFPFVAVRNLESNKVKFGKEGMLKISSREVPSTIVVTFALMGIMLAFGMGLFPLWIFIPPTIVFSMIFVYKVINWVKEQRKQPKGGEE